MKLEWLSFSDGETQLTAIFESRQDLEKFAQCHDKFMPLLPDKPKPDLGGAQHE